MTSWQQGQIIRPLPSLCRGRGRVSRGRKLHQRSGHPSVRAKPCSSRRCYRRIVTSTARNPTTVETITIVMSRGKAVPGSR